MNQFPITAPAPLIPVMEQPVWSEFDIFDLNTLSSPPSWVSGSESSNPSSMIPGLEAEQSIATSRDPASFADYNDQLCQSNIVELISTHSPHFAPNLSRNHFALGTPHAKVAISSADIAHQSIPDADAIVDSALHFQSPASPVLSDLPLTSFDRADNPPASATGNISSFIPISFPSQSVVEHTVLPEHASQADSLASAVLGIHQLSAEDGCSSQESSSCRQAMRALSQSKKNVASIDARMARTAPGGRVQKQTRRYSAPKSSRYCHLCARHQRCVKMIPCGNVELGLCQKSVCKKCIDTYNLEVTGPSWACPHCQNKCPQRAKCFAYDRQTARRREKTLKAKLSSTSVAACIPGPVSKQ